MDFYSTSMCDSTQVGTTIKEPNTMADITLGSFGQKFHEHHVLCNHYFAIDSVQQK